MNPPDGQLLASADHAASAALRELPEALVIVFDRQLRFVLTAGQAIERMGRPEICRADNDVADAFPAEFWEHFEPLFSSALEGETAHARDVDGSTERMPVVDADRWRATADRRPGTARTSTGVAVVLDITARAAPT